MGVSQEIRCDLKDRNGRPGGEEGRADRQTVEYVIGSAWIGGR